MELRRMDRFFERPILNAPYAYPGRHWELDEDRQPTNRVIDSRRRSELITPVPQPKKRRPKRAQAPTCKQIPHLPLFPTRPRSMRNGKGKSLASKLK